MNNGEVPWRVKIRHIWWLLTKAKWTYRVPLGHVPGANSWGEFTCPQCEGRWRRWPAPSPGAICFLCTFKEEAASA